MRKSGNGQRRALQACAALLLCLCAAPASAEEGQWMPEQLQDLDRVHLRSLGLEISPRKLWSGGEGLLTAVVKINDCSGAFVSESGLVATSHRCIYRALRSASDGEHDYLETGVLARKPGEELPAPGYTVEVLERVSDVTQAVLSEAVKTHDDGARQRAIDLASQHQVEGCVRKHPGHHCRVQRFYLGKQYKLIETVRLGDVRIVYAPKAGIGQFGGAIDRNMWPRHSGDFAILRAYVGPDKKPAAFAKDNVPFKPDVWLHLGDEGVQSGDFVAAAGYPARTRRYLPSVEVQRYVEQVLPARAGLYGEWVDILAGQSKRSATLSERISVHKQHLEERLKTTRGVLDNLGKLHLVEQRRRAERRQTAWCARTPKRKHFCDAYAELSRLSEVRRMRFPRALLLDGLGHGPDLLALAVDLVRRAREHKRPDRLRHFIYSDRNAATLWKRETWRLHRFDAEVDGALLASLVLRARGLDGAERIEALGALAGPLGGKQRNALVRTLTGRIRRSTLSDAKHARELFEKADASSLEKSRDPMIVLARALADEMEQLDEERARDRGLESRVGPAYFEMLKRVQSGPVYPDANGTLRLGYGTVAGYELEDGLLAEAQTSLHGAIAKSTGERPFNLPRRLLEKAPAAGESYWADPDLDDLPVCFLSSADSAPGGAGGPLLDGQAHLVGIQIDRVWENIAGGFVYSEQRSRGIGVDIRYMLWLLDRVEDAGALLRELGVSQYRSAPSRRGLAAAPRLHGPRPKTTRTRSRNACGCSVPGGSDGRPRVWWLLLPAAFILRRKR